MSDSLRVKPSPSLESKTAKVLRQYINREFSSGGKLPGEHELVEKLGVNRGTLRGALKLLEQDGLITRRRGDGTYANAHVISIATRLEYLIEYWELIRSSGYEPQAKILSIKNTAASDNIADRLAIARHSQLLVIRQVLSADRNPAIYVEDLIPIDLIKAEYEDHELQESFFDFLENRCFVRLDYTISEIEPCVCSDEITEILELGPCQAILKASATCYSENSKPIVYSESYYNPNFIRFSVLRKRKDI
jgi:GntR family transcriptional regulator